MRPLLIVVALASFAIGGEPARTVILVRHAERGADTGLSTPLNEAGRCRATVLAGMLADAKVVRIYVSEAARTEQTAEPLAKKLGLRPETVPAKDIDGLVAKLRAGAEDATVLVVGHSNTVPAIVERLSGKMMAALADNEYDRMFVVTVSGREQASVVTLRYPGCSR